MRGHPRGRRKRCRHCDMVDFYRLERQHDLMHEQEPAMWFKRWLMIYEWEKEPQ